VCYGCRSDGLDLQEFIGYANHLGLYTEEVSTAGEGWVVIDSSEEGRGSSFDDRFTDSGMPCKGSRM